MTPQSWHMPGFMRHELRQTWRQQQNTFGKFSVLWSPSVFIILYMGLHALYAVLISEPGYVAVDNTDGTARLGWGFIGIVLMSLSAAIGPVLGLVNGRNDWDLIRTAPTGLRQILVTRLLFITARVLMLPLLVVSPLINLRVASGESGLLQFYPALAFTALAVTALAAVAVLLIPARISVGKVGRYATLLGLVLIGAVLFAVLSTSVAHPISLLAAAAEGTTVFSGARWLGAGFVYSTSALLVLAVAGVLGTALAVRPIIARILKVPQARFNQASVTLRAKPVRFSQSPLIATLKKEWRLILRSWEFLSDAVRNIIVLATIAFLLVNEAPTGFSGSIAAILVVTCAVLGNDLSWRMVATDELPDLLEITPVGVSRVIYNKLVAAGLPALSVLICFDMFVMFLSPRMALLAFVFGICAIMTALVLNIRRVPIGRGVGGARIAQDTQLVLAQAISLGCWGTGCYLAWIGLFVPSLALAVVGCVLPGVKTFQLMNGNT